MAHNEVISHSGHLVPVGCWYIGGSQPIFRLYRFTSGLKTSQLQNITQTVNSTYAGVARLERSNFQPNPTTAADWADPNASIANIASVHHSLDFRFQIRTYTLNDISVLHTISQYRIYLRLRPNLGFATVTVQLQKAKRDDDGRIVLVKSYHDKQSTGQRRAVCTPFSEIPAIF